MTPATLPPPLSSAPSPFQVESCQVVLQKPRTATQGALKVGEATVGDASGVVFLSVRGSQFDVVQPGKVIQLTGAKVELFKGTMRLTVDARKGGAVADVTDDHGDFPTPNADVHMSRIEFDSFVVGPKDPEPANPAEVEAEGGGGLAEPEPTAA